MRLANPTTRNVMTGILLTPGPVCNMQVVHSMSRVFMSSVNKSKFLTAAQRLEAASLGTLVSVSGGGDIFVKKVPEETCRMLQVKENQDLCTPDEFQFRFDLPTPAVISWKVQGSLIQMGMVAPHHFKQKERRTVKQKEKNKHQDS